MKLFPSLASLSVALLSVSAAAQQPVTLTVDTASHLHDVSPTLYGLMTEEINFSYDGGLYAEMVRNRSFLKARRGGGFDHWTVMPGTGAAATIEAATEGPSKALATSLKLNIATASATSEAGLVNDGWWGFAVRPATTYAGSFYAKSKGTGPAHIRLVADATGATLAETTVALADGDWKRYTYTLVSAAGIAPSQTNHLILSFAHSGSVMLQLVSLFPPTYHNTPNGNRPDLMELMAAMKPHFLRLPGGNYLEGDTIAERFNWKETIGPLVDRPTHRSPWNYQSTDGMGLLEYLEWCEDLKIEPVLAVFAGYALKGEHVVGPALEPFIQDDLDEIEYVTGDASTKWGAQRARDGHPGAFPLHYIEIGNEDWFDKSKSYDDRFTQIATAIRAKYSQFKLIATTKVSKGNPDLIDDHYYQSADQFFGMVHKYDTMDRNGPKIFIGEWATREGSPTPNFAGALGDAAWMTGMERNSDLILISSYAPLFTNVNPGGMQWPTDLIGYDALRAYGSPSYWAQVLFAQHLGNVVVKTGTDRETPLLFWSATVSTDAKVLHLKLVNGSGTQQSLNLAIPTAKAGSAELFSLSAGTRWATNSIDNPDAIHPIAAKVAVPSGVWTYQLPANSIHVLDIPLK